MKSILLNQLVDKLSGMGVTSVITDDDIFLTSDDSHQGYYPPVKIIIDELYNNTDVIIKPNPAQAARDQFETRWKK